MHEQNTITSDESVLEGVAQSAAAAKRGDAVAALPTIAPEKPVPFWGIPREELGKLLQSQFGLPTYRATQLFNWIYREKVFDFSKMTNIKQEVRDWLAASFTFPKAAIRDRQISADGTRKYLFEVEGGDLVESVMIKQINRMTLCVSSQVGCAMACGFCRTGTMGLKRHLSAAEILMQVLGVIEDAANFGDMFNNIVFMGMGEPLHNFDGISRAARVLTDQQGLEISARKITISTVGLVPAIERFGREGVPANLAVSLNATTDEVRSQVMPVNKRYPIDVLLKTLREFPLTGKKRITIEYVMLAGINDSKEDMKRLPKLLEGIPSKVNLIPYNDNAGLGFKTPAKDWVHTWRGYLLEHGMNATIRWSKGQDIKAACGQLVTDSRRVSRKDAAASEEAPRASSLAVVS